MSETCFISRLNEVSFKNEVSFISSSEVKHDVNFTSCWQLRNMATTSIVVSHLAGNSDMSLVSLPAGYSGMKIVVHL